MPISPGITTVLGRRVDDRLPPHAGLHASDPGRRVDRDTRHPASADQDSADAGASGTVAGRLHGDQQVLGRGEVQGDGDVTGVRRADDHRRLLRQGKLEPGPFLFVDRLARHEHRSVHGRAQFVHVHVTSKAGRH
jgi:hypothetical protein